ncbi:hypothetical protein T484DRAFT_1764416, partial [Baffinella frigidus]
AKLEEWDRVRLQTEDEHHQQVQNLGQEESKRLEALKGEQQRSLEEIRQKGILKEKQSMAKLEATRADNIRAQEDWQLELQEKDAELQRKLDAKQRDFQVHLDSLLSGKVNSAIQDLQEKLTAQQEEGNAAQAAIAAYHTKELELKQKLGTAAALQVQIREQLVTAAALQDQIREQLVQARTEQEAEHAQESVLAQ